MAFKAAYTTEFIAERVAERRRKFAKKLVLFRVKNTEPPYGHTLFERRVIQSIFALRLQGLSFRRIAAALDEYNVKPRRADHWSFTTVKLILERGNTLDNALASIPDEREAEDTEWRRSRRGQLAN
jgi:hypothetical protein